MLRTILFTTLCFLYLPIAKAEMDPSFFQVGSDWLTKTQAKAQPDYNPGYPGTPVFDKYGRPVVFEGQEVSREDAEDYVEQYNRTH
ncbi:hypothetical protein [Methyloglobulus sp.]|uniref:hypothetical protein n=1 Tax=Methyloglobulus sp. TaxID=2518622 RepID=UPI0032B821EC